MLLQIIISFILGLLPEVLYFTLFLIYTKNIKEKRLGLGILIAVAYVLCLFIQRYQVIYYFAFIGLVYLILKLLYRKKTQIIDVFVFSIIFGILCLLSTLCYFAGLAFNINYYICYIILRILMFVPFIFRNKFNILYKKYCSLWNRNDKQKRAIKSITLRNISLILLNLFICAVNIVCLYITNNIK